MRIIGKKTLDDFKKKHAKERSKIESWVLEVGKAKWNMPPDVKAMYPKATILKQSRAIFDIGSYRLLVSIAYKLGVVKIKKIDRHDKYDKWELD